LVRSVVRQFFSTWRMQKIALHRLLLGVAAFDAFALQEILTRALRLLVLVASGRATHLAAIN